MRKTWTRTLNSTTKVVVRTVRNGTRLKVTFIGGEFDGASKEMTAAVAQRVSPKSKVNPRAVAREALRRLRETPAEIEE